VTGSGVVTPGPSARTVTVMGSRAIHIPRFTSVALSTWRGCHAVPVKRSVERMSRICTKVSYPLVAPARLNAPPRVRWMRT
jgi:hypothetical protein